MCVFFLVCAFLSISRLIYIPFFWSVLSFLSSFSILHCSYPVELIFFFFFHLSQKKNAEKEQKLMVISFETAFWIESELFRFCFFVHGLVFNLIHSPYSHPFDSFLSILCSVSVWIAIDIKWVWSIRVSWSFSFLSIHSSNSGFKWTKRRRGGGGGAVKRKGNEKKTKQKNFKNCI